jgi:GH15 family glucan-1,4-alpha-glucosidase
MIEMLKLQIHAIFISLFFSAIVFSQTIVLPDNWIFRTGDDLAYGNITIDELNWTKIKVPGNWEDQGFPNYDGFAWYRLHFTVEEDLGNQSLYLFLGKIDDTDEAYLNGVKIGFSGTFPPNPVTAWNEQRAYKIPPGILKKENVIAIRVYDIFSPGGIHSGLIGILNEKEYQYEMNLLKGAKKSFYQMPTANGLIAAVYNERRNEIENIFPHIFKAYDENKFVNPFIKALRLNSREKPKSIKYLDNTHIISIDYKNFNLKYFASFSANEKIFYAILRGKKENISKLTFSYRVLESEVLSDSVLLKVDKNTFEKYFLYLFNDSLHNNSEIIKNAVERISQNKSNLVVDELNYMKNVFARVQYPNGLTKDEKNIYQQSLTVLKMAQTTENEIFPEGRGQMLASLPPGVWNICWLRDGMYALLGLNSAGLFDEAKKLLTFYLNADAGYYKNFTWKDGKDYGVGKDYQISVTRYFGIGKEESDFNDQGPNIELDGFGFFLYTFADYINRSGDIKYFDDNYKNVSEKVADVLIHCIDKNDLIRIDSGPWERHLPGKHYAYTSIAAAGGLNAYAKLLEKMGYNSEKYFEASNRIVGGIKNNLVVDGKYLKGNAEGKSNDEYEFYDMGMIEAFNLNVINDAGFFNSNITEYDKKLKIGDDRGYSRVNGVDLYDISEWIMIDLRTASAHIKFGQKDKAKKLIDWITHQAKLNFNLIPELFDYTKATYDGAVPMVGFGAGAYIKTLNDFYK